MEPIRVLHIVGIMNMGGIENLLMNVYRNIDRSKIQFDFLVTRREEGYFDEEIRALGGEVYTIARLSALNVRNHQEEVKVFLETHATYEVVHCHRDALCGIYLKVARELNIPIRIAHCHTSGYDEGTGLSKWTKILFKEINKPSASRYATHLIACSRASAIWLYGRKADQAIVLYNGIDTKKYLYNEVIAKDMRIALGITPDQVLIGHIGRFNTVKNHKFLIEIMELISLDADNYRLCLVGSGELEEEIKELVSMKKLTEKVQFLGLRTDVADLLMAFDVFAFPSLFEGMPLTLIEAQASGVNCFVSDRITSEVKMTNNVQYISCAKPELWKEHIRSTKIKIPSIREENNELIEKSSYEIKQTIQVLEKIYRGAS